MLDAVLTQIFKIFLGILGLGVVVFVHELGHFLGARLMGIDVDAFSIGWGKPVLKKKIGKVEYRLGIFPLGGYCKMKGENDFDDVYNNNTNGIKPEKGSYFSAHPFRRIVTCAAGPLFNLIFAVLVFTFIWGIGFEVNTMDNRVILASEIVSGPANPADGAGLKTGDRVVEINGEKTETSREVQEFTATHPGEDLSLTVERNGKTFGLSIRPEMDKSTGAGIIGVFFWLDPVIDEIAGGSPAAAAGLAAGDKILSANGAEISHTMALAKILDEKPRVLDLAFLRDGKILTAELRPVYTETGARELGISWKTIRYQTPPLSPPRALVKGAQEAWKTFAVSLKSLSLLFKGVDLTQAVSGPVRITVMVGDAAADGFSQSFGAGISSMANFLSLISIALCIMNLLPLPVLDGGMILLFLIEGIRKKPMHPRFVSIFQTVGVILIAGLMIFAVLGDIRFLAKR